MGKYIMWEGHKRLIDLYSTYEVELESSKPKLKSNIIFDEIDGYFLILICLKTYIGDILNP